MKITVLTLFPEMVEPFFTSSIMKRAVEKGIITFSIVNFRDYASGRHRKTDDIVYGGGAGMLLSPDPLFKCIRDLSLEGKRIIFPTPSGRLLNQKYSEELSGEEELVFICGHYEGLDQRVIDTYVTDEISIGDYVLSSGETAAAVIIDSVYRLIGGVITGESLEDESFSNGLLEYPQYTRPEVYCNKNVPDVLLSGNQRHITEWRRFKGLEKTLLNRPDLLSHASLSIKERQDLLNIYKEEE